MSKYTPWFSGDVKPARVGVYQRLYFTAPKPVYCHWDGANWGMPEINRARYAPTTNAGGISGHQNKPWRGLTERAK